ncbi:MAG TPA: metallophosphoesterase family protein [Actinomycetota bacterium]|nr:metallophosphoesterase family protein [Actinomycetota bacterium]
MAKIGVISDTHLPRGSRKIPDEVFRLFEGADLILHAGDFVEAEVLYELGAHGPVKGVLGNCDSPELAGQLPLTDSFEVGGIRVGMIHDSGDRQRRRKRMAEAFPGHRVVVFGHSHQPVVEDAGGLLLLNPGSACDPRRARIPTVAILEIRGGQPSARLVEL